MIIFIYGDDAFRSRRKLKELKDKFLRDVDPSGGSLVVIDGKIADINEINEAVGPASLFSRRRMIVVEEVFANKNKDIFGEILDYFNKKEEDRTNESIVIFWDSVTGKEKLAKAKNDLFLFLVKQKYSIPEFKALSNQELLQWIKNEFSARGARVNPGAVSILADTLNKDLWLINNEIDKLISYKKSQNSDEVTLDDIRRMVRGQFDENIFALTDAVGSRNKAMAMKLLEEQLAADVSDIYLLSMIIRQFKILIQIRQAMDSGMDSRSIAGALKMHSFVAQKGMSQARNFSLPALKDIFNRLIGIDYQVKTGAGEARTLLGILIVNL
ncbi:MAG: DNA polymerase III subunit delta [Patescibacteria group bacterium]